MSSNDLAIIFLALFNVYQFYYWSKITERLEDKLMSHSFQDYMDAKKSVVPKEKIQIPLDEIDLNREIQPF